MELRVTSAASRSSLQPSVPAGPHRQDDEAGLGGRVPDPDGGVLRQRDAEVGEHAARIADGARAIGRGLVPDRRQAEHFPGVTGAQRAHDDVVGLRRVLDRDEMIADAAHMAELGDGGGRVVEQRLLEAGIAPGLGHHARAAVWADLGLVGFHDKIEGGGIDIALLGQDGLERAHPQLHLGELRAVVVVMIAVVVIMVVVLVVILGHGNANLARIASIIRRMIQYPPQ